LKNRAKAYFFQTCSHGKRNYKHSSDYNNRKQVIKAGASDLRIFTVVSCISDSHIHQSQQPFLSHCIFYGILGFLFKHTFSGREGYRESGLV